LRPGARLARSGAFACLAALAALASPAAAPAQDAGDRPSVLLVLDSSRSMRAPAGDGSGSRMDAAKRAVGEVLDAVPDDAPLGLRVYGAKLSNAPKRVTCTDTELVAPVESGDRTQIRSAVDALVGVGRTPIGRSLLATPRDFPDDGLRHQVILVSDGLDNCAPPDPCAAARRVARQGVELTISVVGFALDERARRQMRCIARVGGGTYVDANDTDRLREELLAAFARAFRGYEPSGTPVEGGADMESAPRLGSGLYQGELGTAATQTFSFELEPGRRLFAAGTLIVPGDLNAGGRFEVELLDAEGEQLDFESSGVGSRDTVTGRTETHALRTGAAEIDPDFPPGVYGIRLTFEADGVGDRTVPFELALEALEPDARPGLVREPGPEPEPPASATPTPTAEPERTPAPSGGDDEGGSAPLLGAVGVGGLLAGLALGLVAARRRRA
jgi:Ca-activated chloride channel homolog